MSDVEVTIKLPEALFKRVLAAGLQIEDLPALIEEELNQRERRQREWQATVRRSAGALADDPIERPPQGDYEQRDEILSSDLL